MRKIAATGFAGHESQTEIFQQDDLKFEFLVQLQGDFLAELVQKRQVKKLVQNKDKILFSLLKVC